MAKTSKPKKPRKPTEFKSKFATTHAAIQGCLEILGTRETPIPVILPVTAPPEVLSAVLRAGAMPYPVDVDEYLGMCPVALEKALANLEGVAIVLLCKSNSMDLDPKILELIKNQVSINLVSYGLGRDRSTTFELVEKVTTYYSNCTVFTKFEEQVKELETIKNGVLGLHCGDNSYPDERKYPWHPASLRALKANMLLPTFDVNETARHATPYIVRLPGKVKEIIATGKEAKMRLMDRAYPFVTPLYDHPEIKAKWPLKNAEFPMAERVKNEYIALRPLYAYSNSNDIKALAEFILLF